ncbi:EamA family transporter [Streptacidiphilus rugosus]|uniref:EamA family transporter n=1 Tax=Streptacidiphilus rugosus TaxID=405783 RepID=UPI000A0220C4|nr:EamA family transporter [Streptacidiphilus rugosus]
MTTPSSSARTAPFEEHGGWSDGTGGLPSGAPPSPSAVLPPAAAAGAEGERRRRGIPAPLFCLAAMFTVQLGIALSTPLFPLLGVAGTTSLRLVTASAVLLVATRPRLRGRSAHDLGSAALLGLASAGMTLLFAGAVARLPMGTAATIEFLGPLAVALGFSRRLGHVLWALLAAAGVVLLTVVGGGGARVTPSGLAFAFGAAVCLALYILLTHRVGNAFGGFEGLALSLTVAAVVLAPFGFGEAWHGLAASAHPWLLLLGVAGVALLFPVAPYLLEMTALRRLPQRVFSVIASLEPAVSALIGLAVLGQVLTLPQLAGIGCVIAASAGATLTERG